MVAFNDIVDCVGLLALFFGIPIIMLLLLRDKK